MMTDDFFYSSGTIMADKYKAVLQTELQNNDLPQAAKMVLDYLDKLNNIPLNIAITGESGIKNRTEGAAPTGAVETTMEPTEYTHTEMPNIRIWDLPGIGTTNFTADKYLEYVGFEKYDFFIIVSCDRFRENDAKLAKEIQKMNKKFYFLGFESPKVFLVSGFRLHLYEIKDLWKTLQEELPKLQRDTLLLALPNISTDVIEQKKQTLERNIIRFTLVSAAGADVPIPGVSEHIDLSVITSFTVHCTVSLGLTPKSLQKLSDVSGVSLEDLREELKSPLAGVKITPALVQSVLARSSTYITSMKVSYLHCFKRLLFFPLCQCQCGALCWRSSDRTTYTEGLSSTLLELNVFSSQFNFSFIFWSRFCCIFFLVFGHISVALLKLFSRSF
uniref:IRG-type G domain-containing protein n=1 Tax=Neogobius melanostomus TaxID=47308 RepID=A0A8C6TP66_9GOBI